MMKTGLCSLKMPCSSLLLLSPFFYLSLFLSMKSGIPLPLSSLIWPSTPHKMAKHGLSRFCQQVYLQKHSKPMLHLIQATPCLPLAQYFNATCMSYLEPSLAGHSPLTKSRFLSFHFPSKMLNQYQLINLKIKCLITS